MVNKAIISVAGWDVDRLPVSKAVGSHLLPLGNRPAVDYIVQECVLAGVREIYFVINKGDRSLERYYSRIEDLENYLQVSSKLDFMQYAQPPQGVKFYYIEQDMSKRYGNALSISLCAPYIKPGESVVFLSGSDIVLSPGGGSELARMMSATPQGASSLSTTLVPLNRSHRYGRIEYNYDGTFYKMVRTREVSGDESISVGLNRYLISYDLVQMINSYASVEISGEYDIVDPLNQYSLTGGVTVVIPVEGQYIDVGEPYSWLYGNRLVLEG